jgi:hypothetical protein
MTVDSVEIGFDDAKPINASEPRSEPDVPVGKDWSLATCDGSTGPGIEDAGGAGMARDEPARHERTYTREYFMLA